MRLRQIALAARDLALTLDTLSDVLGIEVAFNDPGETHIYVEPLTGKVAARRSNLWRTYDFLWSLHIMDYSARENFNHWPIVLVAALSLATDTAIRSSGVRGSAKWK